MDPTYRDFRIRLAASIAEAALNYALDHPGKPVTASTDAGQAQIAEILTGIAHRRLPRNRRGKYMMEG